MPIRKYTIGKVLNKNKIFIFGKVPTRIVVPPFVLIYQSGTYYSIIRIKDAE